MTWRIFNSENLITFINTTTWSVINKPRGTVWYEYDNSKAPILYSIYQRSPEKKIVLDEPYTAFRDEKGNSFDDDVSLQKYLNRAISSNITPNYLPYSEFFEDYGSDKEMAIDASISGSPELVHNGLDTVAWTGTQLTGGADLNFSSNNQAFEGLASVFVNRPDINEMWQFERGSFIDLSAYASVTMYIYVDNNWNVGDNTVLYGFDTTTGLTVGNEVDLKSYFDPTILDVWQKLVIPLSDMGLTSASIDAFRMLVNELEITNPRWYIDNFQIERENEPVVYALPVGLDETILVNNIRFNISSNIPSTLAEATMPNLSYNSILGVPAIADGINVVVMIDGSVALKYTLRQLSDFLDNGGIISSTISDGVNTRISIDIDFDDYFIINNDIGTSFELSISDDLSGLISLTVKGNGKKTINGI